MRTGYMKDFQFAREKLNAFQIPSGPADLHLILVDDFNVGRLAGSALERLALASQSPTN